MKRLLISIGLFSFVAVANEDACSINNQGGKCAPFTMEAPHDLGLKLLPGELPKAAKKSSGTRKPQSVKETAEKNDLRVKAPK